MTNLTLEEKKELIRMALAAREKAYVPYSDFMVGAALRAKDGRVYTGCNVENAALGDTICAERTACVKAISEGYRDYVRLAIYAESQNYCMPCGSCRQFLSEFNDGELEILCCKADGRYVSYRLKELLPYTFNY